MVLTTNKSRVVYNYEIVWECIKPAGQIGRSAL